MLDIVGIDMGRLIAPRGLWRVIYLPQTDGSASTRWFCERVAREDDDIALYAFRSPDREERDAGGDYVTTRCIG